MHPINSVKNVTDALQKVQAECKNLQYDIQMVSETAVPNDHKKRSSSRNSFSSLLRSSSLPHQNTNPTSRIRIYLAPSPPYVSL